MPRYGKTQVSNALWVSVSLGQSFLWLICLLPALPFLSTILLILSRGRRYAWIFYLIAWGLTEALSLLLFFGIWASTGVLMLWGAGFGGMLVLAVLAGEILTARLLLEW